MQAEVNKKKDKEEKRRLNCITRVLEGEANEIFQYFGFVFWVCLYFGFILVFLRSERSKNVAHAETSRSRILQFKRKEFKKKNYFFLINIL